MDAPQFNTSQQANRLTSQLLRVVIIIWLAVLLRWLLVKLHEPGFYLAEFGDWAPAYYLFPALILLTLALILIPPLILGRGAAQSAGPVSFCFRLSLSMPSCVFLTLHA